jgi:hypothetical protein
MSSGDDLTTPPDTEDENTQDVASAPAPVADEASGIVEFPCISSLAKSRSPCISRFFPSSGRVKACPHFPISKVYVYRLFVE